MKNTILCSAAFFLAALTLSCGKTDMQPNCYKVKLLSNVSNCGTVIQIIEGEPTLPSSSWWGNVGEGPKYQRAYAVEALPKEYENGKPFYIKANKVAKFEPQTRLAVCGPSPEYYIEMELVDKNCTPLQTPNQ